MSTIKESDVVARIDSLTVERLDLYISHGWVAPDLETPPSVPHEAEGRQFADIDIARLQLIEQLREDMGLNEEAVPVVLALLDQVHGLRHQLRCLGQAVEQQPEDVRQRITALFDKRLR
ncbi:chaperone modulator CbpM [Kordiimonas sp.]|uniref:chaperone modulator CbpM n=1 Tax=Kordiimonas sp. TaxID=1970157 RepID=UPI003A8FD231